MNRTLISYITLVVLLLFGVFVSMANAAPPAMPGNIPQQAATPTQSATAHDSALVGLMERLQSSITKLQPGATIGFVTGDSGDTLRAQYQTQQFLVYLRGMTGEIYPKPEKELGPNYKGFLLEVSTVPAPFTSQLVPGQVLRKPYWSTYYDVYEIKHPREYLVLNLSYGVRTNPKLISQIEQIVADYAAKR